MMHEAVLLCHDKKPSQMHSSVKQMAAERRWKRNGRGWSASVVILCDPRYREVRSPYSAYQMQEKVQQKNTRAGCLHWCDTRAFQGSSPRGYSFENRALGVTGYRSQETQQKQGSNAVLRGSFRPPWNIGNVPHSRYVTVIDTPI